MQRSVMLGLMILAVSGCSSTLVIGPDPIPVIGAQMMTAGGSCMDLLDGNTTDGTAIDLFHCHGSANQRWFIMNGSISQNAGSCLNVQGSVPNDGTPVVLVTCNGSQSQRWSIVNGQVVGVGGKCLGSAGGATADLTALVISECSDISARRWTVQ